MNGEKPNPKKRKAIACKKDVASGRLEKDVASGRLTRESAGKPFIRILRVIIGYTLYYGICIVTTKTKDNILLL